LDLDSNPAVLRIRIRKDPKLLAGSGSEINLLDPDSNPDPKPDPKQICKKKGALYLGQNKA